VRLSGIQRNPVSRTPLFREMVRAFRLAQHSLQTGASPHEAVELQRERRALSRQETLSRREFLGVSGAAAGTLLLGGSIPLFAEPDRARTPVLIVGAGIAGLTAGYRLRQAGVPVRIVEAQNRVGGRIWSLRDHFPDGQVVELGGELIDTCHTQVRALACELGIPLDDLAGSETAPVGDVWFFDGMRRSDAEVVEAFLPVAALIQGELRALGEGEITYRHPRGAERLDRTTIAEWFDRVGVRGWFRELLDVAYTTEYGLEIDRQSALNFLQLIDPRPSPFRIFGESDERFHVRGGNDLITQALAARLAGAIETGTVLEAVRARGDGGFTASFRRGETSFEVGADHLLLTLPFTLLREVELDVPLPVVKQRAINELGYGTNAKLMVGFSERVWRNRYGSNGSVVTDLPFQLTWETSRAQPGSSGVLTNFTGGLHGLELGLGTAQEQAAFLVRRLDRVFPGAEAAHAGREEVRFHWPTFPWTKGSYASYLPGQWTGIRGAEQEPVGRLYFAGEHCSLDAQGFMEGGCETGEVAAREILKSLRVRPRGLPGEVERCRVECPEEAVA
jgi:monoamine oxidase